MVNTVAPKMKDHVFSRAPRSNAPVYSTFDRSFRHLTSFDAGYLIPAFVDEVYPGDIYRVTGRHLSRLIASVHPFMDNLTLSVHFFYCPTRLVWNNFKAFMGERRRPEESISNTYQVPMLNTGNEGIEVGTIFHYAGIPANVPNLEFSSLPLRCINLCYNEWFRDENLCDWLNVGGTGTAETEFGDSDQLSNYKLFKRAKAHDYFTSALPFQQKGEAMSVSIGKTAPVGQTEGYLTFTNAQADGTPNRSVSTGSFPHSTTDNYVVQTINGASTQTNGLWKTNLVADLEQVTGFTISDLRTSIQLQALKELQARCGTRYKEIINGEWNVQISDATLDRPEFLGSYNIPFDIVTVASTAETTSNPQGNLSAYGVTTNQPFYGFSKGFEEHGFVIGFLSVRTDQSYQQGLNRMWSRKNRYDFYTPLLANISEQAIKMKEILAQGSNVLGEDGTPVDERTFGYQEAGAELRYKPNMITGKMFSGADDTLDVWHLGTYLAPTIKDGVNYGIPLNEDFINDNTDFNLQRVLAVKNEPQILSDNYFKMKCTRELPLYSVPAYLFGGRF